MALNVVGKIEVERPMKVVLPDLSSPDVVRKIWAEADRAVRADRKRRSTIRLRRA